MTDSKNQLSWMTSSRQTHLDRVLSPRSSFQLTQIKKTCPVESHEGATSQAASLFQWPLQAVRQTLQSSARYGSNSVEVLTGTLQSGGNVRLKAPFNELKSIRGNPVVAKRYDSKANFRWIPTLKSADREWRVRGSTDAVDGGLQPGNCAELENDSSHDEYPRCQTWYASRGARRPTWLVR